MSFYTRRAVESSAEAAAKENRSPRDACPYRPDFAPVEFNHWRAVFLLNGGDWGHGAAKDTSPECVAETSKQEHGARP